MLVGPVVVVVLIRIIPAELWLDRSFVIERRQRMDPSVEGFEGVLEEVLVAWPLEPEVLVVGILDIHIEKTLIDIPVEADRSYFLVSCYFLYLCFCLQLSDRFLVGDCSGNCLCCYFCSNLFVQNLKSRS